MYPRAADILNSQAWEEMVSRVRTSVANQFFLCKPDDVAQLVRIRQDWDALNRIIAVFTSMQQTIRED